MNKLRVWLSGLLGLQLVLALVFYIVSQVKETPFESEYLLGINIASVNKLTVSAVEGSVEIVKSDKGWVLPSTSNLPADTIKIERAIQTLYDFKTTWPVTTLENAHERFEVAENKFRRKLTISQDNTSDQVVFIGTSPSFRKSHVRPDGEVDVYSLAVNDFDYPSDVNGWLDKSVLKVSGINKILGPDYILEKLDTGWQVSPLDEANKIAGTTNTAIVDELVSAFTNLELMKVADQSPTFEGDNFMSLTVANEQSEWIFQFVSEISMYYIKRNDIDAVFTLAKMDFKRLTRYTYQDFVSKDVAGLDN